ncbi:hypothetical protein DRQ07_04390 [candidate division KSB1 bacterium]|nr:MAG: hypothetical protein DRQ07_04390 [candidate division KSB1 bacterium]
MKSEQVRGAGVPGGPLFELCPELVEGQGLRIKLKKGIGIKGMHVCIPYICLLIQNLTFKIF